MRQPSQGAQKQGVKAWGILSRQVMCAAVAAMKKTRQAWIERGQDRETEREENRGLRSKA